MTDQEAKEFLAALGSEIAAWRKRRRFTRGDLASLVGVSETSIGRIERGGTDAAVGTSVVWRIARALDLKLSDLVRRAEEAVELSERTKTDARGHGVAPYSFDESSAAARREDDETPQLGDG